MAAAAPVEVLASADGMRHMEITMRLKRDYVEITDVIWAVHDRSTGTPFIKKVSDRAGGWGSRGRHCWSWAPKGVVWAGLRERRNKGRHV